MENQNGRSMIEMLGVLAIVGVLSVGGIAGYSKAMTKYKINRWVEEMHLVTQDFLSYKNNWIKTGRGVVTKYMQNIGIFPKNWKKVSASSMNDSLGNSIYFVANTNEIYFNTIIKLERADSTQICLHYWTDIIIPYTKLIQRIHIYRTTKEGERGKQYGYNGDMYCTPNRDCISDLGISDFVKKCAKVDTDETISISVYFR